MGLRVAHMLRGWRRAGIASVAFASTAYASSNAAPDTVTDVEFTERPHNAWIEVAQRAKADAFIDFAGDWDMAYVEALRTVRSAYSFPLEAMQALRAHFLAEAKAGLAGAPSSLRMLPTYVTSRVTGSETGDFYALDLGGTNFRVLRLTLEGDGKVGPITQGKFKIPTDIKQGTGDGLFGFLADSVATFLATECGGNPQGVMGFTFSFPTVQEAINIGRLIVWNKEFSGTLAINCTHGLGLSSLQLVQRGINLEVRALANDTVGTMEAAAYSNPDTVMGVIFGTGTNGAYIEKGANIGKWAGTPCDEMVINTEWGNLEMASTMNLYDAAIDAASQNPGNQRFEKMISGMYLGEMCRVTITSPEVLQGFSTTFAASLTSKLAERMSLPTALMADIEDDKSSSMEGAARALEQAGLQGATARDCALVRDVCVSISTRAAMLSATAVVSLLQQMGKVECGSTVAIDGTVFECYPFFKERMEHGVELLMGKERAHSVKLVLAKDGSGVGAAIIAAIAKP